MDYNVPIISMYSGDVMTFAVTMAITFFVVISFIAAYSVNSIKLKISTYLTIASGSVFFASLFSMLLSGQLAYQFSKDVLVLHQVAEEASDFDVPLNPELQSIFSEFKDGQSADGVLEKLGIYSDLHDPLKAQIEAIESSVRGEEYAKMKGFLSLCFPGEAGADLHLTMGSYPPKKADLKAQADKALKVYIEKDAKTAYSSHSGVARGCAVSYLVSDFL